ncbi:MAG: DUF2341 domain-containing protein [Chitinivibrionales bacterium]|nr:DUF2341 domain-containing protein [Chitinivibrionales bacterium]MBD3356465.1 DUF2341 domain-containing protein [Chitinivibrionales bacterium]
MSEWFIQYGHIARLTYVMLAASLFQLSCTSDTSVNSGWGSETTNGIVRAKIVYSDGRPAAAARARLRPADYIATQPSPLFYEASIADTVTNSQGSITLHEIEPGEYSLEVAEKGTLAVLSRFALDVKTDTSDLGTLVLRPVSSIVGKIRTSAPPGETFVSIYGLERIVAIDSATGRYQFTNLPEGSYTIAVWSTATPQNVATVRTPFLLSGTTSTVESLDILRFNEEDYSQWRHHRGLRINTTTAGADVHDDVHSFPLLVRIGPGDLDFSEVAEGGRDIRFSKPDGTKLRYEIDTWDGKAGTAVVWVLVDTIRGNNDTQSITMHWGGPDGIYNFSSPRAVFDSSFGHTLVWHIRANEASDSPLFEDATPFGHHGIPSPIVRPSITSGVSGSGALLDSVPTYANISVQEYNEALIFARGSFSISFWKKGVVGDVAPKMTVQGSAYRFQTAYFNEINQRALLRYTDSTETYSAVEVPLTDNEDRWHHHALIANRATGKLVFMVDGAIHLTDTLHGDTPLASLFYNDEGIRIRGDRAKLDELRCAHVARGSAWIRLAYETQREGQTVVTFR